MTFEIKEKKENNLLSRTEYVIEIGFAGPSPSKKDVKNQASKALKANESVIVIKHVYIRQSQQMADGIIYVYKNEEQLKKIETKNKKKKTGEGSEEQKPAEEKK